MFAPIGTTGRTTPSRRNQRVRASLARWRAGAPRTLPRGRRGRRMRSWPSAGIRRRASSGTSPASTSIRSGPAHTSPLSAPAPGPRRGDRGAAGAQLEDPATRCALARPSVSRAEPSFQPGRAARRPRLARCDVVNTTAPPHAATAAPTGPPDRRARRRSLSAGGSARPHALTGEGHGAPDFSWSAAILASPRGSFNDGRLSREREEPAAGAS